MSAELFDPSIFAAEFALAMIPSEEMPSRTQDALVAGFDGKALVRLAGLENPGGWEVDQLLPHVLENLGVEKPGKEAAAVLLAKVRARRVLASGEDPLLSIRYFYRLMLEADYPKDLIPLGYADELAYGAAENEVRRSMREEIENFLDPDLAEQCRIRRQKQYEEERYARLSDWPYVVDSRGGRRVFYRRLREHLLDPKKILSFFVPALIPFVWGAGYWRASFGYLALASLVLILVVAWKIRASMERECREIRQRQRIDI